LAEYEFGLTILFIYPVTILPLETEELSLLWLLLFQFPDVIGLLDPIEEAS